MSKGLNGNPQILEKLKHYKFKLHADRGDINDIIYKPPQGVKLPEVGTLAPWRAPIRDQGEEGSCTAFTGRGGMELLNAKVKRPPVELSPQSLYHNELILVNGSAKEDTGASIRTIVKALQKYGIAEESVWPYSKKFSQALSKAAVASAAEHKIIEYQRVTSLYDLMYAIAIDQLPVAIGITCYQSMMTDAVAETGVVPMPKRGDRVDGGHALLCDSYDTTHKVGPFAVFSGANSWGDDWGGVNDAPNAAGAKRGLYHLPESFVSSSDCINDAWILIRN